MISAGERVQLSEQQAACVTMSCMTAASEFGEETAENRKIWKSVGYNPKGGFNEDEFVDRCEKFVQRFGKLPTKGIYKNIFSECSKPRKPMTDEEAACAIMACTNASVGFSEDTAENRKIWRSLGYSPDDGFSEDGFFDSCEKFVQSIGGMPTKGIYDKIFGECLEASSEVEKITAEETQEQIAEEESDADKGTLNLKKFAFFIAGGLGNAIINDGYDAHDADMIEESENDFGTDPREGLSNEIISYLVKAGIDIKIAKQIILRVQAGYFEVVYDQMGDNGSQSYLTVGQGPLYVVNLGKGFYVLLGAQLHEGLSWYDILTFGLGPIETDDPEFSVLWSVMIEGRKVFESGNSVFVDLEYLRRVNFINQREEYYPNRLDLLDPGAVFVDVGITF